MFRSGLLIVSLAVASLVAYDTFFRHRERGVGFSPRAQAAANSRRMTPRPENVAPAAPKMDDAATRAAVGAVLRASASTREKEFPRVKPDFFGELSLKDPPLWTRYVMMLNPLKEFLTRISFACVARSEPPSTIRFAMRVSTREREVVLEPGQFVVATGAPLSSTSNGCIARRVREWNQGSVPTQARLSRLPDFDVDWLVSVGNRNYDPDRGQPDRR